MTEAAKHTPNLNDGGFAFPFQFGMGHSEGMTLREWFAGQALPGLLAGQYRNRSDYNLNDLPAEAYRIADAMIAAGSATTTN